MYLYWCYEHLVPGKPAAADLRLGLATAPVLFASQQFPQLRGLVARRFRRAGDVEAALALVAASDGLQRTRELAGSYSEAAVTSLQHMRGSGHKQELLNMAETLANRAK